MIATVCHRVSKVATKPWSILIQPASAPAAAVSLVQVLTFTPCDEPLTRSPTKNMLSESAANDDPPAIFGFYSVMELDEVGFCGGFLVLNEIGRPLEFHCTLPVKPERSQQILYGKSLRNFLYSEHIGPPLVHKARNRATIVLVNQSESIELGRHIEAEVALVTPRENDTPEILGANVNVAARCRQAAGFDLQEPFERIAAAIDEANSVTRQDVK